MSRQPRASVLVAAAVLVALAALTLTPGGAGGAVNPFGRQFLVQARAFPAELDPGQNRTGFPFRPLSQEAAVASSPLGGNGRSSVLDLGITENQFPPPEEAYARCDSVSPNVPDQQERAYGTVLLAAECTDEPEPAVRTLGSAATLDALVPDDVLATFGVTSGVISSQVDASTAGGLAVAESRSSISELAIGPLAIDEVRYVARVESDGSPGSATATADIDVVGADVNGIPVIVSTGGVRVDESEVPAEAVPEATAAIQQFFSWGGYADIRVVYPEMVTSDDGSHASARGGGLAIFMTSSGDPADRYFFTLNLLGGRVALDLGAALDDDPPLVNLPYSPSPVVGAPFSARPTPARPVPAPAAPVPEPAVAPPVSAAPEIHLAAQEARRSVAGPSSWWLAPLVAGILGLGVAGASTLAPLQPARRRVERWWDSTAERYLRG
jgi:hypothetical protein